MSIVIFLAVLGLIYVLWMLMVQRGIQNLSCQRRFSRTEVFEGESGELVETVRNDGPYIIPWVRVESYISPKLRLGRQENLEVSSDTFYRSWFTLLPYQQIRRRHYVEFLSRGVYNLGNAAISGGDLFGLTRFWKDQQLSTPVTVYPRILDTDALPYPLSRTLGELVTKNRLQQDPFVIRGIRPYQPGDLVRDIHWQATARTQELQVRVHEHTVCTRLLVVLNAQHRDDQWDDYIRDKDVTAVEDAIRLAASLCIHGLRSGLAVGFAANLPGERQGKSTLLAPMEGTVWEETLLEGFARLQLHCSEKFVSMLKTLEQFTDTDIVVLSPYDSESIRMRLDDLRQRGNQVTFYRLEGGSL